MKLKWLGFSIFVLVIIQFLYYTLGIQTETSVLLFPIIIVLIFGLFDYIMIEKHHKASAYTQKDLFGVVYVLAGFVLTMVLGLHLSMDLIMASALTGFIGYVLIRPYEKEVYLGSFAGMVTISIANPVMIGLLVILLPLIYLLSKDLFNGYGGKLGTVAFVTGFFAITLSKDYEVISMHNLISISLFPLLIISFITVISLGLFKIKFKLNAVMLSSTFVLVMSILLRNHPDMGLYLPLIFALSFVIMSDDQKMKNITFFTVTPLAITVLYMNSMHVYTGFGGKAGLIALLSVLTAQTIHHTLKKTFQKSELIKHASTS